MLPKIYTPVPIPQNAPISQERNIRRCLHHNNFGTEILLFDLVLPNCFPFLPGKSSETKSKNPW